jgi:hypothetical protein
MIALAFAAMLYMLTAVLRAGQRQVRAVEAGTFMM